MIIFFIAVFFMSVGVYFYFQVDKSIHKEQDTKKEEKQDSYGKERVEGEENVIFSKDNIEVSEQSKALFNILSSWGKIIYEKGDYQNFSKKSNMYFISLNDLNKKYSYDISQFKDDKGNICDVNSSGIYFDSENTLQISRESDMLPIVPSLVKCVF